MKSSENGWYPGRMNKDLRGALEQSAEMLALITGPEPEGEARDMVAKRII